ncbi:MAG: hypothetical protein J5817_11195 [Treponema sp.]|nr:hypothetical protein [Treponema sp.]
MAGKSEHYKKLDAAAREWVRGLKEFFEESGTRSPEITTNTNNTERAIRSFLGAMGFENYKTINKTTMLYVLYNGLKGGMEYIGVDSERPTPAQVESAMSDMAENVGVTPKALQDWMNSVIK